MKWRMPASLILGLALFGLAGCGSGLNTYPVTGKVVFADDQSPVPRGHIEFTPAVGGGPSAVSRIGEDGTFTLITSEDAEGAEPGKYKVTIRAQEKVDVQLNESGEPAGDVEPAKSLIDTKYSSPSTTDLEYEVKAEDNNFTIPVERAK